jgi:oligopeptide/dipeptide ABC transporter ATP-binding protein
MTPVLSIEGLTVRFRTARGPVTAVADLSFDIQAGETVALVGESGSGKSTAALSILRLVPDPPGEIAAGRVSLDGRDLAALSPHDMREVRGRSVAMIFQDPLVALNPLRSIGRQMTEVLRVHGGMIHARALPLAIEALRLVGMPSPEKQVNAYPHNLSGGMRQRAMIAMALLCRPRLLVADEPTTALDVTVQAQVLSLITALQAKLGMAVLLITHDFGVVAETAKRVVVMYAGRKVEDGPVEDIFANPRHPYTRGLLDATRWDGAQGGYLPEIPGSVPSALDAQKGCAFAGRCRHAMPRCRAERPAMRGVGAAHEAACFLIEDGVS